MSLPSHALTVCLVLLASPTAGAQLEDLRVAKLRVGSGPVSCEPGVGGVGALVRFSAPAEALPAPVTLGGFTIRFSRGQRPGALVGAIDSDRGPVRCKVGQVSRGTLRLLLGRVGRDELLTQLKQNLRKPTELPELVAHLEQAKHAEKAIAAGKHQLALKSLRVLRQAYALNAFADMRIADVYVLLDRIPSAYSIYARVAGQPANEHAFDLIARVRAAVLAHVVDGDLPAPALVRALLRHTKLKSSPTLVVARAELATILLRNGRGDEAMRLALLDAKNADLARRAMAATIGRRLRAGDAFKAAAVYMRGTRLLSKDAFAVAAHRRGAEAFLALDLPKDATKALQAALAIAPSRSAQRPIVAQLVAAYVAAGSRYRALQAAEFYLARLGGGASAERVAVRQARAWLLLAMGNIKAAAAAVKQLGPAAHERLVQLVRQRTASTARDEQDPRWQRLGRLRQRLLDERADHPRHAASQRSAKRSAGSKGRAGKRLGKGEQK